MNTHRCPVCNRFIRASVTLGDHLVSECPKLEIIGRNAHMQNGAGTMAKNATATKSRKQSRKQDKPKAQPLAIKGADALSYKSGPEEVSAFLSQNAKRLKIANLYIQGSWVWAGFVEPLNETDLVKGEDMNARIRATLSSIGMSYSFSRKEWVHKTHGHSADDSEQVFDIEIPKRQRVAA